jgi:putative flippase GtrA
VKLSVKVRKFLTPTFIKWSFVGSVSLLLDIGVFTYSYHLIEIVTISNFVAAVFSTTFNYLAHYFWTFNSATKHRSTLKRYLLNILFLWATGSLVIVILLSIGVSEIFSKAISMSILLPFNYFVLRKYVYFEKIDS